VCVNGGCIPDQSATFACTNDGQGGAIANRCSTSEICLHHSCYTACAVDAAPACSGSAPTCKSVTIETGTYEVCGSDGTLGSECDPAQNKYPAGCTVCVDGYCK
jgi:hypothetical protein